LLHLRDGMSASHQDPDGGIVQLRFAFELTGLAKGGHGVRIEEEGAGRQRGMREVAQRRAGRGVVVVRGLDAAAKQRIALCTGPRKQGVGDQTSAGALGARTRFRPEFLLYDWS